MMKKGVDKRSTGSQVSNIPNEVDDSLNDRSTYNMLFI